MPPKTRLPSCSPPSHAVAARTSLVARSGGAAAPPSGGCVSGARGTPSARASSSRGRGAAALTSAPTYGDVVDSDEVHDEIRELGTQVSSMIAQHLPRHGTSKEQVMWGVRQFGPSKESRRVLNKENDAARLACETGVYCVWRCREKPRLSGANQDFCCRLGYQHVCFCGHPLAAHTMPGRAANASSSAARDGSGASPVTDAQLAQWRGPCEEAGCSCTCYRYVPNTPLEIGEAWLTRRANWNASQWSAKCKCGQGHKMHDPTTMRCKSGAGGHCPGFTSAFLCVVCDLPWEAHETVWESEGVREREGRPVCEDYAPLAGVDWDVREVVLADVSLGGRIAPPASYLALQQRSSTSTSTATAANAAVTGRGERGASTGGLPAITAPVVAADPVLDVEYCRYCATVYKRAESKFCATCGKPRPAQPRTLR
ncbi:hypothetical protein NESM_000570400 [Novymonas esmeraldas]|uniref:Uncharacterized protein n=1 Tax=Novymonas esmeraldas TaxID=1808958 RepID=A0AAW0ES53_9TRYP